MTKKQDKGREELEALLAELDRDILQMPEEVVRSELSESGLDYDQVAEEGLKFIETLLRDHTRQSWMDRARRSVTTRRVKMRELSARAQQMAQEWLKLGHPLPQGAFAGREESQISREERLALLTDLAMTKLLEEVDSDEG